MTDRRVALLVLCIWFALAAPARAQERAPSSAYDGRWFVALVCDDTQDRKGELVKGYEFQLTGSVRREVRPCRATLTKAAS